MSLQHIEKGYDNKNKKNFNKKNHCLSLKIQRLSSTILAITVFNCINTKMCYKKFSLKARPFFFCTFFFFFKCRQTKKEKKGCLKFFK